jgi:hypothetical protein
MSIAAHYIMSSILYLAASGKCMAPGDYPEEIAKAATSYVVLERCAIPLVEPVTKQQATALYRAAKVFGR